MQHSPRGKGSAKNIDGEPAEFVLCLYVVGASPNSARAIANLKDICDRYLTGRYSLEIIDVYQQPGTARTEGIVALPLLIKRKPVPQRKLIGDLRDTERVLKGLGIKL